MRSKVFFLILILGVSIIPISFNKIHASPDPETFSQTRLVNNIISAEWENPANAFVEDDFCTYTKTDGDSSYYNFINNPFTIPEDATINGLRAEWRWGGDGNDYFTLALKDANLVWTKAYGPPPEVGCSDAVLIGAGSPTNLWGATWTPVHINSANFVCWFLYTKSGKANFLNIDYMELTVWYEWSPEPPSDPNLLFGAGFNSSTPYVELHWNHSLERVEFFEIQNSSDAISWEYLGQSETTNYTDYEVFNGTARYYKVRACNYTDAWFNSSFSQPDFEIVYFISVIVGENGDIFYESDFPWIALAIILSIVAGLLFTRIKR